MWFWRASIQTTQRSLCHSELIVWSILWQFPPPYSASVLIVNHLTAVLQVTDPHDETIFPFIKKKKKKKKKIKFGSPSSASATFSDTFQ